MGKVSRKFAERVSSYKAGGLKIASAEGSGISRSRESFEEGLKLSEASVRRLQRRAAQSR